MGVAVAQIAASRTGVRPRIRLRYVLLALTGALVAYWFVPRARLAWHLHDAATQEADYALCMAGPTGAVMLRDEPSKFWQLVRRRVVASGADDKPFVDCGPIAQKLTGSPEIAALHQAPAREFADWGSRGGTLALGHLASSMPNLMDMAEGAWPFTRGGAAMLIKPSLGAKEAMHPIATMRPGSVQGLPLTGTFYRARRVTERGWFVITSNARETKAYRSRDQGRRWTPTSPWQTALQGTMNRCLADVGERGFAVEQSRNESGLTVTYYNQDSKTGQSAIAKSSRAVRSFACDETAALLLTSDTPNHYNLWMCAVDQPCRELPAPSPLIGMTVDGIDVARQKGATVVAVTQGALVRVLSSRDDGRSYTPFTVAIDHQDACPLELAAYQPAQLLSIANSLLILQEPASGSGPTLALSSSDQGASWHAF